jgi:hypothetical protein
MTSPNRSEILFVYDAQDCNPNGNPIGDNRPRRDPDTGQGIITDVRLKRYLRDQLIEKGLTCRLNDLSSTVVLERPMDVAFVKRWQLACEEDNAHVVVMPNVTRSKIDRFVEELMECTEQHGRVKVARPDSPLTKLGSTW